MFRSRRLVVNDQMIDIEAGDAHCVEDFTNRCPRIANGPGMSYRCGLFGQTIGHEAGPGPLTRCQECRKAEDIPIPDRFTAIDMDPAPVIPDPPKSADDLRWEATCLKAELRAARRQLHDLNAIPADPLYAVSCASWAEFVEYLEAVGAERSVMALLHAWTRACEFRPTAPTKAEVNYHQQRFDGLGLMGLEWAPFKVQMRPGEVLIPVHVYFDSGYGRGLVVYQDDAGYQHERVDPTQVHGWQACDPYWNALPWPNMIPEHNWRPGNPYLQLPVTDYPERDNQDYPAAYAAVDAAMDAQNK